MNDSKEYIITVTSKLFLQKSYKEVTMKDIVEATGLSKGGFYHYFSSKEQLFLEVLDFFFTSVMNHPYDTYSKDSFFQFYHDYANGMKGFGKKYFEMLRGDESESQFNMNYFTLAFDALKLFPEFREKMLKGLERELAIWVEVIKNAREKGEIRSAMTDEEIAKIFIFLSDGVGMHMIFGGANLESIVSPFLELWDKLYEQIKA